LADYDLANQAAATPRNTLLQIAIAEIASEIRACDVSLVRSPIRLYAKNVLGWNVSGS
jgi:hypothetical protein